MAIQWWVWLVWLVLLDLRTALRLASLLGRDDNITSHLKWWRVQKWWREYSKVETSGQCCLKTDVLTATWLISAGDANIAALHKLNKKKCGQKIIFFLPNNKGNTEINIKNSCWIKTSKYCQLKTDDLTQSRSISSYSERKIFIF